ncbi:MAG: sulfurtransferase-like selenium metabolism protein YedF [Clostridium sp.]
MRTIDCKGLECPKPVINTKKALEKFKGEAIEILVDNDVAKENVSKFLMGQNKEFTLSDNNGVFSIVTVGISTEDNTQEETVNPIINSNEVILISNNKMGQGDDKLGDALMKSFMFALSESNMPSAILFVNAGVKLTTTGSDVLETLKTIEERGVTILSCGTCLDFYSLKDELKIGGISNMYTIIEHLQSAGKVINL